MSNSNSRQARGGEAPWSPNASPAVKSDSSAPTLSQLALRVEEFGKAVESVYSEYEAGTKALTTISDRLQEARKALAIAKKDLENASARLGAR